MFLDVLSISGSKRSLFSFGINKYNRIEIFFLEKIEMEILSQKVGSLFVSLVFYHSSLMFSKGVAEMVTTVVLRDKIEKFFLCRKKGGMERFSARISYRTGWKPWMKVSVVWRIIL